MRCFPIPKRTGTHADALAAIGLADLFQSAGIRSTLSDNGSEFQVHANQPVTVQALRRIGVNPGYEYLLPNEKERSKIPKAVSRTFDYPDQKAKRDRWRDAQKAAKNGGTEFKEQADIQKPRPDFVHYMVLNILQGDGPLNKSVVWFYLQDPDELAQQIHRALGEVSQRRTPAFGLEPELVQLFNPQAAKGYARLKPDSTSRNDSTKEAWAQPFVESLRFRGYFQGTASALTGDDVRLYTAEPKAISYRRLQTAINSLRDQPLYGGGVKVDCLGVLAVADTLVRSFADFPEEAGEPSKLLSGVAVTHYKSLGQAKAVAALSRLAMPGWFKLDDANDIELWTEALNEYRLRLRRLDDSISDEIQLLVLFRRYLETRGPDTLLRLAEFHESYGIYLMRKRGQNDWRFPQFSVEIVERILSQQMPYSEVIQNTGFQAIAKALRSATVSAQVRKRNKERDVREIRYDILPELRRERMVSPDQFLLALSNFVESYNAESAKRLEQGKSTGIGRIDEADFAAFLSLFDSANNPMIIGALLCSYATCKGTRSSSEPEGEEPAAPEPVE